MVTINQYGQSIGTEVSQWQGALPPELTTLTGQYCRIVPLDTAAHAADLFAAFALNVNGGLWTYLPYGPFVELADYQSWLNTQQASVAPLFYTIIDAATDKAVGVGAYLWIDPQNGAIEVDHLSFSPLLQRTPIATEAQFLLMQYALETLGYRRYEWKCDRLNAASCRAAERLGVQFEGVFRQAVVYKNRNRDTSWFSVLDSEWPILKTRFTSWLSPDNEGLQKKRLQDCA